MDKTKKKWLTKETLKTIEVENNEIKFTFIVEDFTLVYFFVSLFIL